MSYSEPREPADRSQSDLERRHQHQFGSGSWSVWEHTHVWQPPTDVYEIDNAVVVRIEIAGVQEADINIRLQDQLLIVTGKRTDPSPKVAYHQLEVRYGEFRCDVYLHWMVDEAGISANYHNGFLEIHLPTAGSRRAKGADASQRDL